MNKPIPESNQSKDVNAAHSAGGSDSTLNLSSQTNPKRNIFRKTSADWWMLQVVVAATVFIIAVDWLGATLLHRLFGPRDDSLLLEPFTISIERQGNEVMLFSLPALSLAVTVLVVYVLFWVLGAIGQRKRQHQRGLAKPNDNELLNAGKKSVLSVALLIFAIALGWASTGLEQWLVGDIGTLERLSGLFSLIVVALFLLVLGFLYLIKKVNRRGLFRYWLVISLLLAGVTLTILNWYVFPAIPPGTILLLLSLVWGYVLFQLVWSYAIPQNFSTDEKPPRQTHLISFVSKPFLKRVPAGEASLEEFAVQIGKNFGEQSKTARDLIQSTRQWVQCEASLSRTTKLPSGFPEALMTFLRVIYDYLEDPQQRDAEKSPTDAFAAIDKKTIGTLEASSSLELNLLTIYLLSRLWSSKQPYADKGSLSELIQAYQTLLGIQIKWLMPVISVEYNLGLIQTAVNEPPGSSVMSRMTFIFSEADDEGEGPEGSVEIISQFAWLFEVMFRRYYALNQESLSFEVFLPEIDGNRKPLIVSLSKFMVGFEAENVSNSSSFANPIGIDFRHYEQCSQAIVEIIRNLSKVPEDEIGIDFTGGQKITTMSAVLATTFSHATSQYVDTNYYTVYGFDMRYHDIRFLIS